MLREVYARVEVTFPAFAAVHLTPDAAELGLTVALPETVSVATASPAGDGAALATIPIVGRRKLDLEARSA